MTPTGIAAVAPNTYYFGEWNTGDLMRLELAQNGSVNSTSQVYKQNGGIIAVEMASNGKLYFSSPDAIYSYDVTAPVPPTTNIAVISLEVLAIIVASAALVIVVFYYALRFRRTRTSNLLRPVKTLLLGVNPVPTRCAEIR